MYKQQVNKEFVNEYKNGLSFWDISRKHNETYKNVTEAITGRRFEARFLPIEEKQRIIDLYVSGISTVKIGKIYGVGNKSIAVVLEEYGVRREQKKFVRKYHVNENYFDCIDTQEKAYCLGFIAADGCNYPKKGTISMSLEECDKEILEKICLLMDNTRPLEYLDYSNKHDFGYSYKNQYRMLIFSSHMCNALINVGIMPSKSNQLKFPDFLNDELISHYLRGLSDGDGTLGYKNVESFTNRSGKRLYYSLTSTIYMCESVALYLKDKLDIDTKIVEARNHNGITYTLNIIKKDDVDIFLEWLYCDSTIFLKRKHDLYQDYLLQNVA